MAKPQRYWPAPWPVAAGLYVKKLVKKCHYIKANYISFVALTLVVECRPAGGLVEKIMKTPKVIGG
jgi:hypothetical protein